MPSALTLSITDVIASVSIRFASCGVRAWLSVAMVTQARSGACFTTPSPVVTMTGGAGGCWAATGAARVRATRSDEDSDFNIGSPLCRGGSRAARLLREPEGRFSTRPYREHAARKPMGYEYRSGGTLFPWRDCR